MLLWRAATRACLSRQRLVLVMAVHPDAAFIPAERSPIEPLVNAPHCVQSACICGICVIHYSVFERESAHPGHLADVRRPVGADCVCEFVSEFCLHTIGDLMVA